ncbi:MAG: RuvX/YqgF family protein [bacterium]|nr:RuvX/YqgF family protein [bacterium]MDZ4247966.1 RuvX/YqgF family protein [Patescibacteria group bacterium]
MKIVAIDLGAARSGLAVSDDSGLVARPLRTVPTDRLADELRGLVEEGVARFVVGRPRTLEGELGKQAAWVDAQVERLKAAVPATYEYEDETGSTAEAAAQGDGSDAAAARVILQGYLDARA